MTIEKNQAYLSLGSNINSEKNLMEAVSQLAGFGQVVAVSKVYETPPIGDPDQPNYLNAVVLIETSLSARELKERIIPQIENSLGRIRTADKYAARPMDIDLLLFNHDILSIGASRIPHPEILERAFVAIPLAEIAPDVRHPITGQTFSQIAQGFSTEVMKSRSDFNLSRLMQSMAETSSSRKHNSGEHT